MSGSGRDAAEPTHGQLPRAGPRSRWDGDLHDQEGGGGEAEFDFDSDPGDVLAGATRIPATFIRARSGPDVVAEILNGAGQVVATQGAECRYR